MSKSGKLESTSLQNQESPAGNSASEFDRLIAENQHLQTRIAELENQVDLDGLTGLLNRQAFERELVRAISYAQRHQLEACLLYIDVDGFKAINDAFGHAAGDAALRNITSALMTNIRQSDLAGRLGGDEFGAFLLHAGSEDGATKAAMLSDLITGTPLSQGPHTFYARVSIGVAPLIDGDTGASLMERADMAMYDQKRQSA